MVLDLPAALAVDILAIPRDHLVADNGEVALGLVAKELFEQRTNDGAHAGGQNDNGHVVLLGPVIEFLKVWVQLHVLLQDLDALVVRGLDALEHEAEGVTDFTHSMVRRCSSELVEIEIPTGNPCAPPELHHSTCVAPRDRSQGCQSATLSQGGGCQWRQEGKFADHEVIAYSPR